MPQRSKPVVLSVLWLVSSAFGFAPWAAHGQTSGSTKSPRPTAKVATRQKPAAPKPKMTVKQWFAAYDQIRTNAEMTMADKWQSLLLEAKKPDKDNAALAIRMTKKYTIALSDVKRLGSIPETKPLQAGYVQYFTNARKLFADYLTAQKAVPFTNSALVPTKKKLEVLDTANKKIDAELRNRYGIKKH